jgi:hypothetical protein
MILEMKNGGINEIYTDTHSYGGCSTCDYGSSYINEITFELTTGNINIEVNEMYEYALSDGYMMKLMLNNVNEIKEFTEDEFFNWLKNELDEEVGSSLTKFAFKKLR